MRTHIALPLAASTLAFILGCSGLGIEIPGMEDVTADEAMEEGAEADEADEAAEADEAPPAEEDNAKDTGHKEGAAPEPFAAWTGLPLAGATLASSGTERVTYEHAIGMPVDTMRSYVEVAAANGWNRPDRRTGIDRTAKEVTLDRSSDGRKLVMSWTPPAGNGSYTIQLEVK